MIRDRCARSGECQRIQGAAIALAREVVPLRRRDRQARRFATALIVQRRVSRMLGWVNDGLQIQESEALREAHRLRGENQRLHNALNHALDALDHLDQRGWVNGTHTCINGRCPSCKASAAAAHARNLAAAKAVPKTDNQYTPTDQTDDRLARAVREMLKNPPEYPPGSIVPCCNRSVLACDCPPLPILPPDEPDPWPVERSDAG